MAIKFLKRMKNAYIHYVSRRLRRIRIENRVLRSSDETVTEAARVVNTLIEMGRVERGTYLEIGVEYGYTFVNVKSDLKYAVDPNLRFNKLLRPRSWRLHETNSDEFFSSLEKSVKFDVVFLDGLHTSEQTYRDFCNCLPHLKSKSVVIIDDTVPSDEFSAISDQELSYQLRLKSGKPGDGSWHGDVFRVIEGINSVRNFPFNIATISNLNNPKTVIWISPELSWPINLPDKLTVNSKYSDFFAPGFIHESFKPMTEQEFYRSINSEH